MKADDKTTKRPANASTLFKWQAPPGLNSPIPCYGSGNEATRWPIPVAEKPWFQASGLAHLSGRASLRRAQRAIIAPLDARSKCLVHVRLLGSELRWRMVARHLVPEARRAPPWQRDTRSACTRLIVLERARIPTWLQAPVRISIRTMGLSLNMGVHLEPLRILVAFLQSLF